MKTFGGEHQGDQWVSARSPRIREVGLSTTLQFLAIETMYPGMRLVHVFLGNGRYHHAKLVQAWLGRPGVPGHIPLCAGLLSASQSDRTIMGINARQTTHNKCYATFKDFSVAILTFLRDNAPEN